MVISFQGQRCMDYLFRQWNEFQIMIDIAFCLLIKILPKNLYSYSKGSPAKSGKLNRHIFRNRKGKMAGAKSRVQFYIDSLDGMTEMMVSWSRPNVESPHELVMIIGLQELRFVSNQKSCIDPFLNNQLPLMNVIGVSFLHLIPQLRLRNNLILSKGYPAQRAPFVLDYKRCLMDAIFAENVLTFDQTKGFIIHTEANGAVVLLCNILLVGQLLLIHRLFLINHPWIFAHQTVIQFILVCQIKKSKWWNKIIRKCSQTNDKEFQELMKPQLPQFWQNFL